MGRGWDQGVPKSFVQTLNLLEPLSFQGQVLAKLSSLLDLVPTSYARGIACMNAGAVAWTRMLGVCTSTLLCMFTVVHILSLLPACVSLWLWAIYDFVSLGGLC